MHREQRTLQKCLSGDMSHSSLNRSSTPDVSCDGPGKPWAITEVSTATGETGNLRDCDILQWMKAQVNHTAHLEAGGHPFAREQTLAD